MKKLEGVLGKLKEFVDSRRRKDVRQLLETAEKMNLTVEESAAVLKLATRVDYDIDTARQLKAAGRLNAVESRALDKLLDYAGR